MFRRLVITSSIVFALAGTAAIAQGFRGKGLGGGARSGQSLERLQQKLNLTEAQMQGIRALQETRRTEMASLRQDLKPKRQALRQLLQESNPNPMDVGNATLALQGSRAKVRDINRNFISGVKALLTPDQLQKLPKRLQ
jgi:Spy/CpxP family protein refolding chaperone